MGDEGLMKDSQPQAEKKISLINIQNNSILSFF